MPQLEKITTAPALTFDALVGGEPGAPLVLLLHGFAESMHCWRAQVTALAGAGYRAIAPGQRGYSPGARPDTSDTAKRPADFKSTGRNCFAAVTAESAVRHCEERSDEVIHAFFAAMDCFAEPVIGRAFARPVGSQ